MPRSKGEEKLRWEKRCHPKLAGLSHKEAKEMVGTSTTWFHLIWATWHISSYYVIGVQATKWPVSSPEPVSKTWEPKNTRMDSWWWFLNITILRVKKNADLITHIFQCYYVTDGPLFLWAPTSSSTLFNAGTWQTHWSLTESGFLSSTGLVQAITVNYTKCW